MVKQSFMMEDYMLPPEVKLGEAQDFRVDVWSLGQILYQMLSEPKSSQAISLLKLNEEANWLPLVNEEIKALAGAMTNPSLEHRPSIK